MLVQLKKEKRMQTGREDNENKTQNVMNLFYKINN